MRTKLATLTVALGGLFATTVAFGQTLYVWTGAGNGTNLVTAANWNPNGVPNPTAGSTGDIMEWDGQASGNLSLTFTTTAMQGYSGGDWGLHIYLTSNQVNSVDFVPSIGLAAAIRLNNITVDSGAGAFTMGDNSQTVFDTLWGGTNPETHTNINNSANPVTIQPNVRIRAGGGGPHVFVFDGSGDWIINNYLNWANNAGMTVTKSGSGTLTWTGTNIAAAAGNSYPLGSPLTIDGGTVILKSPDLYAGQAIVDNGVLKYDAAVGACTLSGTISGTGAVQVASGTLTLSSGNSTLSGDINLTGGELIAGGAENPGVSGPLGLGGRISFQGGTLRFSVNNAFDYSGRFETAADQAYSFDTAGQNVTFTNGLTSSGGTLTKLGSGTLTLAGANTYSGDTTVSVGRLLFQGAKSGTGNIIVADGAILGVAATGTQVTPDTLTVGTSSGATLGFNDVSSTTTALIAAGTVSAAGTITINVNSGTFAPGQSYPLLSWTSGSAPAIAPGVLNGFTGTLSTNGNTIELNVTSLSLIWTGSNNGTWDTTTPNNWILNGSPVTFSDSSSVVFDDTASTTNVTVNGVVQPSSIIVNNDAKAYTIASSSGNDIGGSASLTKDGGGMLTLSGGANTYTGPTTISGGTLSVGALANGGSASDIGAASSSAANLVLNGGTLQFTGSGASVDRLFTLTAAGGTIDSSGSGALLFNATDSLTFSGEGPRTLTLTGAERDNNTLAASIADNGGATALTKSGAGLWVLTGTNTYSGMTTIAAGTLQVGAGDASGSLGSGVVVNNGALNFNRTGTVTVSGAVSGTGSVTNDGPGTVILAGNNAYLGGTVINAGALQVGNGGPTGSLAPNIPIADDGTLIFNTTGAFNYVGNGLISGTGNVIVRGSGGLIKAIGANSYTGWTQIDPGATFQPCEGNTGQLLSSVVTNNGALKLVRQDTAVFTYSGNIVGTGSVLMGANNFNLGDVTLTGTNTYTGGTVIGDGTIIFGDGFTPGAGSFVGDVIFTNNFDTLDDNPRTLEFYRPDDFIFSGNITTNFSSPQSNLGIVQQNGSGTVTLTGNNNYAGGTVINAGTLQVGNGGTSGSLGTGNVTANGMLIFNRSDDITFRGDISGAGGVTKNGAGTLTLFTNSFAGYTVVSNGSLIVNGDNFSSYVQVYGGTLGGTGAFAGPVAMEAGTTIAPGASAGSIGTIAFNGSLTFSGNLAIDVNKSLSQSNDFVVSPLAYNSGTGTVTVANRGPALAVGDKFTLFDQAVQNGAALTVTGAGATWANNLEVDGSITALTVTAPQNPTNITFSVSGNQLTLNWPSSHLGWILQVQTNSLATGLSSQWFDVAGSGSSTQQVITVSPASPAVFYRLRSP